MKTKRTLFILLTVVLLAPAGLLAQKIYKTGTGSTAQIVLDMTNTGEGIGLPAGSVTATKKYTGSYSPSTSAWLINATDNMANGSINATVYRKLEIAPRDLGTSGLGSGTMIMQWPAAFSACKGLNYNGSGWRLPTQRELMLMWIFRTKINDLSGTAFLSSTHYWAATENSATNVWYITFTPGYTNTVFKTNNNRARCVREL